MKNHLKKLATPRTWGVFRKSNVFITRPNPGMMELSLSISINTLLTEILGLCKNKKEVKYLLTKRKVLVDGKRRKDDKFPVSLGSVLNIDDKQFFRLSISEKGKLTPKEITEKEAHLKLAKITNKTLTKKGLQLNLFDGRNILVENADSKVGDSVLIKIPEQKIEKNIPLQKGSVIFIYKGNYAGITATVEEFDKTNIKIKTKNGIKDTKTAYVLVVGDKKSEITL